MESRGHKPARGESKATVLSDASAFALSERTKRVVDIAVAMMGLVFFAPILLITSIAIKLDSYGPIFIRETLHRRMNRPIRVLKFRVVRACTASDHGVTWVGRIVSETGISELPQLVDVIRGEMSIVGRRNVQRWPASLS